VDQLGDKVDGEAAFVAGKSSPGRQPPDQAADKAAARAIPCEPCPLVSQRAPQSLGAWLHAMADANRDNTSTTVAQ